MKSIQQQLVDITQNFILPETKIKCESVKSKETIMSVLKEHYNNVSATASKKSGWIIKADSPKILTESLLTEENNIDLDPEDDFDLDGFDLDSLDDSSQVEDAENLTALKKRAADLATKWKETFKQISELGKKLNLTVSHNDELEIIIDKPDGSKADIKSDLDTLEMAFDDTEDVDDSFGPSAYDDRANKLGPDVPVGESLVSELPPAAVNEQYPFESKGTMDLGHTEDPNELYLDPNRIDDDF